MAKKKKTKSQLKKGLWKWFSLFIRLRPTDDNGYSNCVTCGAWKHFREVDAGHFITRGELAILFNEINVQFQCKRCNMRGGEQYKMAKYIDGKYGEGTSDGLQILRHSDTSYMDIQWYREKIEYYTHEVRLLSSDL